MKNISRIVKLGKISHGDALAAKSGRSWCLAFFMCEKNMSSDYNI